MMFVAYTLLWLAGVVLLDNPTWRLLVKLKLASPITAGVLGFVPPVIAAIGYDFANEAIGGMPWLFSPLLCLVLGLVGAAIGIALWLQLHRRDIAAGRANHFN